MKRSIGLVLLVTLALFAVWLVIPVGHAGNSSEGAKISKQSLPRRAVRAGDLDQQGSVRPESAGLPNIMNEKAPLSTTVFTFLGGRNATFNDPTLLADFSGRESYIADRAAKVDSFTGAFLEVDETITRTAISEHTVANGFNENVFYYGDSVGNLWVGTDTNPGINPGPLGSIDFLRQVNVPALVNTGASGVFTLLNPQAGDCTDDQVTVTGIAVNPVADLGDFGLCNTIGEVVYVSTLDTGGCSATGTNQPFRSRIFAFAFTDGAGAGAATPAGALQILRNPLGNSGIAVDDDGSLYFHLVDLIQNTTGAIFKVTESARTVAGCGVSNPRVNRVVGSIPSGLTGGISLNTGQGTTANPIITAGGMRLTNYSGPSTTFGNIVGIAAGRGNTIYAAVARSLVPTDDLATQNTEGRFPNPAALGATPSMIISFADSSGAFDVCSGDAFGAVSTNVGGVLPVGDGIADVAKAGLTRTSGVNNFRVFALGTGPDIRPTLPATSPIVTSGTLKLAMQIDPSLYAGITVDEDDTVYAISGGMPAGLGTNPSPQLGEILAFQDSTPADRRADFIDFRGDSFPGTNVGDGDSDRFDHIYWQAPNDGSANPSAISGLARGFLRYTNRLAPNPISPGITLGQTAAIQGDDATDGPIRFDDLDPSHQAAGGDDQNAPFKGDDTNGFSLPAGVNNPALGAALEGGFEFVFGVTGGSGQVWNAFFLNSNGNITFNGGDSNNIPTTDFLYSGNPRIAPAWGDMNPSSRNVELRTFPVQALGFSSINAFKVRNINVPEFGSESCTGQGGGRSNTFSVTLSDDGTGIDENSNKALDPADPTGDNVDPAYDLQEGPTDLRFTREPTTSTLVGATPRADGTGNFVFDYGRMDILGTPFPATITGYSGGGAAVTNPPGLCEVNLSEAARAADTNFGVLPGGQTASVASGLIGEGTEPAIFELFNQGIRAVIGPEGTITFAVPDFDLKSEGNDPALSTSTFQRDLNRDRIAFNGFALPRAPLVSAVLTGPFVVAPNQPTVPMNALGPFDVLVVGSGFFPNEVTTVCQGGGATQRAGKTVTTSMTLAIDNNGDAIPESTLILNNVTPVNANLVRGTLVIAPGLPGTVFPLAALGPFGLVNVTTSFTTGDNNALGAFTRSSSAALNVGKRAPVVLGGVPTIVDCGSAVTLAINGASFKQGDGTTANVTSVSAVDPNNPGVLIPATTFSITDTNNLSATFNLPPGSGGKSFLIFAGGPNGTSRNLITLPAGTPGGVPTGNEAGNLISFACGETFQFSAATFSVTEDLVTVPITITRGVAGPGSSTVDFATSDGTAVQTSDYTATFRTITFGPGETSKTINVPITEDAFVEGNETVNLTLSNPTGGVLGGPSTAVLTIVNDDLASTSVNPIDDTTDFVGQQYHDFLNRQGDTSGVAFWIGTITSCGADPTCIQVKRINASAAFFLSIEFQESGFNVIRSQRVAFGKKSADPATRFQYLPFLKDGQQVGAGVIIGQPGADALLEANKQAYAQQIVTSAPFIASYPVAQTAAQFVDALFATAAVAPTAAERTAAITAFGGGGTAGRTAAFRSVVDATSVRNAESNAAFVLMQYYGYLRRNPTDPPDNNDVGYQFWLSKLNSFGGNFINAELVKAFLTSTEYRQRFGTP